MNRNPTIPPLRDLPAGQLEARKRDLLTEIRREPQRRLFSPTAAGLRLRLVAVAAAGAAATAALAIVLVGSLWDEQSPFLVQALHGPAWTAYEIPNWGGDLSPGGNPICASSGEVLFGCGGILALPAPPPQAARHGSTNPQVAPATKTEIAGGTAAQRTLLRSIVAAMPPSALARIELDASGDDVTLRVTAADTSMRTIWESSLIAAAFRDRAGAAGEELSVSLVNGESAGVIPPGPAPALSGAARGDAAAARERFERAAAAIGVPLELTIYEPYGVAVAATLRSDDPAAFLVRQMPRFLAAVGDRWRDYDGTYIRLVDGSGATAWETSTTARTASGAVGSREDLAGCSPIASWGPTPPPCSV